MTEELGPISYGQKDEQIFLGREISRNRDYSDKTAEAIDSLMRTIIEEQVQRTTTILKEHREELERLAQALLEHELLDREEIMKVIAGDTLQNVKKTRSIITRPVPAESAALVAANSGSTVSEMPDQQTETSKLDNNP